MKGIIVQDKRRILVRFCHGYEKLIWIGALRLRYEYLSQVELQEMMLNAKLSSAGKWLIFSETRQSVSVWTKKLSSHFRNSRWTVIWPLDDLHKTGGDLPSVRWDSLCWLSLDWGQVFAPNRGRKTSYRERYIIWTSESVFSWSTQCMNLLFMILFNKILSSSIISFSVSILIVKTGLEYSLEA